MAAARSSRVPGTYSLAFPYASRRRRALLVGGSLQLLTSFDIPLAASEPAGEAGRFAVVLTRKTGAWASTS